MRMDFLKNILRKGFYIELDEKPMGKDAFLDEIEKHLTKDGLDFKFIEKDKPAIVSIDKVMYKCELIYKGRSGWTIKFLQV